MNQRTNPRRFESNIFASGPQVVRILIEDDQKKRVYRQQFLNDILEKQKYQQETKINQIKENRSIRDQQIKARDHETNNGKIVHDSKRRAQKKLRDALDFQQAQKSKEISLEYSNDKKHRFMLDMNQACFSHHKYLPPV